VGGNQPALEANSRDVPKGAWIPPDRPPRQRHLKIIETINALIAGATGPIDVKGLLLIL